MRSPRVSSFILLLVVSNKYSYCESGEEFEPNIETDVDDDDEKSSKRPLGILRKFDSLVEWAMREEEIFNLAKARYQRLKSEVEVLEEYIKDYESTSEQAIRHARKPLPTPEDRAVLIASSGIAAYRMTYRYVQMLQKLREILAHDYFDRDFHDIVLGITSRDDIRMEELHVKRFPGEALEDWPNRIDLQLAMQSLNYIQDVYSYNYQQLIRQMSPETNRPPGLTAFHCAEIGLFALHRGAYFHLAIEWIEMAIRKVVYELDDSIPLAVLENYLELVVKQHNDNHEIAVETTRNVFTDPVIPFDNDPERQRFHDREIAMFAGKKDAMYSEVNHRALCRFRNIQTSKEQASLKCWYDHTSNPAWAIKPLKTELLSVSPRLVQVYEFIGERIMAKIRAVAEKNYDVADVNNELPETDVTRIQTSVSAMLAYGALPEFNRELELLTGFSLAEPNGCDHLYIAEYTYGGTHGDHHDALLQEASEKPEERLDFALRGDRIRSVLVYLNDVPVGGETSYTSTGAVAKPLKGSAVIWNSLYRNGTVRQDVWHGGCPVVYGHKFIINQCIRYNAQFLKYPCTMDPNE